MSVPTSVRGQFHFFFTMGRWMRWGEKAGEEGGKSENRSARCDYSLLPLANTFPL